MDNKRLSRTRKYNNNHFIIASRAYFQQSSTCTRVNNLALHGYESNTHRVLVLIMFCPWKRFSQWICNIQIRVHFANVYVLLLDRIADGIEVSLYVSGPLVKPWFLGQSNGTSVVTEQSHWVQCTRHYSKICHELLHPDTFLCHPRGSDVLRFACRISYHALLGTAPANRTPIKNKYVSGLRLRFIRISVKACIDVTLYD